MEHLNQNHLYHEIIENHPSKDWVVFVHGAGGSVRTWKYQMAAFKQHFNILLLDLRDHGDSQHLSAPFDGRYTFALLARDIVELMDYKGIDRAHFVGVSMGSIVIRWIFELAPELMQSMVLAGGVFRLKLWIDLGLQLGIPIAKLLPFRFLSRSLSLLIMPQRNHQAARRIFLREADRIDPKAFHKWLNMTRSLGRELRHFFKKPLDVKGLVVMGGQDHAFLKPAKRFTQRNPNFDLRIIPKCGHVCNIEAARTFNQLAVSWLLAQSPQKPKIQDISTHLNSLESPVNLN